MASSTVYVVDSGPLIGIERTLNPDVFPSFFGDLARLIQGGRFCLHADIAGEIEGVGMPKGRAWLLQ